MLFLKKARTQKSRYTPFGFSKKNLRKKIKAYPTCFFEKKSGCENRNTPNILFWEKIKKQRSKHSPLSLLKKNQNLETRVSPTYFLEKKLKTKNKSVPSLLS